MKPLTFVDPSATRAAAPLERPAPKPDSGAVDAAQKFEQIFLRRMVGSLMQTAKLGGGSKVAGSEMYDSMIVDALSTSLSTAGGLGLAQVIQERLDAKMGQRADSRELTTEANLSANSAASDSLEQLTMERPTIRPPPLGGSDSSPSGFDRLSSIEPIRSDRLVPPRRVR